MRMRIHLATLAILLTLASASFADNAQSAGLEPIASFVDGQTILVMRLDVGAVDIKAMRVWVETSIKSAAIAGNKKAELLKSMDGVQANTEKWVDQFKKAGGRQIYLELNVAQLQYGPTIIVPLGDGADAAAMENLFATGDATTQLDEKRDDGDRFAIFNGCMIFGNPDGMPTFKKRKPAARPDLAELLAKSGDAPIRVAMIADEQTRASFVQMAPELPPEFGGVRTADLLSALESGYAAFTTSPAPSPRIVLHYKDAASAATAAAGVKKINDAMQKQFDSAGAAGKLTHEAMWAHCAALLAPAAEGDKLALTMKGDDVNALADALVVAIADAVKESRRTRSLTNLHEIEVALSTYREAHGAYPADFAELLAAGNITGESFINPATGNALPPNWKQMTPQEQGKWVNEKSDYFYPGPAAVTMGWPASSIVVAHEKYDPATAEGVIMLFQDGSAHFEKMDEAQSTLRRSESAHKQK